MNGNDQVRGVDGLRSCETLFRLIAENIRDVFFLVDAGSGRVVCVSPAYDSIWGRSCESLVADPGSWIEAIVPDDRDAARDSYQRGLDGESVAYHFRIARPDGAIRWIEARTGPVRDAEGRVVGIAGVAADISERKQVELELRQSRQWLDGIVASAMDAIVSVDDRQRIVLANAAAEAMFGYPEAELLGRPLDLLMPERFRSGHFTQVEAFSRSGATSRQMGALREIRGLRRNGEEFPLEASISRNEATGCSIFTAILRDVTERQRTLARVGRANRLYAVLSAINSLIVRANRRDELFDEACRIVVEQGGCPMAWIGMVDRDARRVEAVASAGADAHFLESIRDAFPLADEPSPDETFVAKSVRLGRPLVANDLRGDPTVRHAPERVAIGLAAKTVLPLRLADKVLGVFVLYSQEQGAFDDEEMGLLLELAGDIAFAVDHIAKAERIDYLVRYDAMTGLANQSLWNERLHQRLLQAAPDDAGRIAVFALDIEHFRSVNQALGRQAGDDLLRLIAQRFAQFDDPKSSRFARTGADRFAVFAYGMGDAAQVGRYVERRLDAIFHDPFRVADSDVRVAVKVGIALHPSDGEDPETLLRHAEAALKKAKAGGQRYLFFAPAMTERVAERLSMENRLRRAIDNDEFVLHYQPKIALAGGQLTGAEALIRWNDPTSGLVPPGAFIPILEETGLIHEVGRWAMRKAVGDFLRWRDANLPAVRIAVNVSPLQLRDSGFADEVGRVLGIDARAAAGIELEITESVIMEDVRHNIAVLDRIRALGATIAIDDFGTGFSSLSYLAKLPVDTLKIDRAFIVDMVNGPDGLGLVSTIINLAHSMNLKVVAEGVETEEQARLLRLLRCEQMQGYLFSKPVPRDVFEAKFLGIEVGRS